jgi:uncharacterized protein (TIGR03435 family)
MRAHCCSTFLLAGVCAFAQSPTPRLTFDAVSVKPSTADSIPRFSGGPGTGDPGRWTATRCSLGFLIALGYDLPYRLILGPDWLKDQNSHGYDIAATMPGGATMDQFRPMVRNMLEERFHLKTHRESRSQPGYELVVAPGGVKLKEWNLDASMTAMKPGADPDKVQGVDAEGFYELPPRAASYGAARTVPVPDGVQEYYVSVRGTPQQFGNSIAGSIDPSAPVVAQPQVVDKTGLTGIYEFRLHYVTISPVAPAGTGADMPVADDPSPSSAMFAALEKQLGLKLQKVRAVMIEVLVVDGVDQVPVGN